MCWNELHQLYIKPQQVKEQFLTYDDIFVEVDSLLPSVKKKISSLCVCVVLNVLEKI
jgi:hypothetical protein